MKILINTEEIAKFKPCDDRFNNWKANYTDFNGDVLEFLELDKITHHDKIWVAVRVLPRFLAEIFAIDCAVRASEYDANATTTAADAAADAVAYVAYIAAAAYAAADAEQEQELQIEALKYLIETEG
jgi:hypothetical protein